MNTFFFTVGSRVARNNTESPAKCKWINNKNGLIKDIIHCLPYMQISLDLLCLLADFAAPGGRYPTERLSLEPDSLRLLAAE